MQYQHRVDAPLHVHQNGPLHQIKLGPLPLGKLFTLTALELTCSPRLMPSGMLVSPCSIGIVLMPLCTSTRVVLSTRSNWVRADEEYVTIATWSKCWPTSTGGLTSWPRNDLISSRLSTPGGWSSRMLDDVSTTRTISNTQ